METCLTCHTILGTDTTHADIGACLQEHTRQIEVLHEAMDLHDEQHGHTTTEEKPNPEGLTDSKILSALKAIAIQVESLHEENEKLLKIYGTNP